MFNYQNLQTWQWPLFCINIESSLLNMHLSLSLHGHLISAKCISTIHVFCTLHYCNLCIVHMFLLSLELDFQPSTHLLPMVSSYHLSPLSCCLNLLIAHFYFSLYFNQNPKPYTPCFFVLFSLCTCYITRTTNVI